MSVNKAILVGNVGKDPEVRYLENGVAVARLTLATSESYKNKSGEKVKTTEWHNVVLWRGLAEIAEKYVRKGQQLYIEGRIRTRTWNDKDGNKHYTTEIIGDSMQMLGKKDASDATPSEQASEQSSQNPPASFDNTEAPQQTDDLPF